MSDEADGPGTGPDDSRRHAGAPGSAGPDPARTDGSDPDRAPQRAPAPEAGHSATPPPGAVGSEPGRSVGAGPGGSGSDGPDGLRGALRTSMVTGAAITVPLLITLVVVTVAASIVSDVVSPVVFALSSLPVSGDQNPIVLEVATVFAIVVGMGLVGYVAAYRTERERLERPVDRFMSSLPGIGSIYETFNQMSEFIVDSDTDSFQEVVLVEYPTEGSYALAFKTAEPPDAIPEATGHDRMETLFMPMGPNPVAGGFVIHVDADRVHHVDLTVEQGIQSIVTSGVATGTPSDEAADAGTEPERAA